VRDATFLHNEGMFALAQKKNLFFYDSNGIELHCLHDQIEPKYLEFLPYHFLLVSTNMAGYIKYLDVSTGAQIADSKTKKGEPLAMALNPYNAVTLVGHGTGEVTMWTPNFGKPVVTMLCHPGAPLTSIAATRDGNYFATTGKDARVKIWDARKYEIVHDYFAPVAPTSCSYS